MEKYLVIFQSKSAIWRYNSFLVFPSEHSRGKRTPCSEAYAIVGVQRKILRLNLHHYIVK